MRWDYHEPRKTKHVRIPDGVKDVPSYIPQDKTGVVVAPCARRGGDAPTADAVPRPGQRGKRQRADFTPLGWVVSPPRNLRPGKAGR